MIRWKMRVWLFNDFVFFDVLFIDRVKDFNWNKEVRCEINVINYFSE